MTVNENQPWVAGVRELNACLPTLPQQEYLRLLKTICGIRDLNARIPIVDQIKLALCEWLKHLGDVVGEDQRRKLLEKLDCATNPALSSFAGALAARHDSRGFDTERGIETGPLETCIVALHDYRYATWPGQTEFWDIEFEEPVKELPEPAVTLIVCNVTALYLKVWTRLKNLRSRKDAGPQSPVAAAVPAATPPAQGPTAGGDDSGDAPRGRDVRDRPVRVVPGPLGRRKGR